MGFEEGRALGSALDAERQSPSGATDVGSTDVGSPPAPRAPEGAASRFSPAPSPALAAAALAATPWLLCLAALGVIDALLGPALAWPRSPGLLAARSLWSVATSLALGVGLAAPVALAAYLLARVGAPLAVRVLAYGAGGTALAHEVLARTMARQADAAFDGAGATPLFVLFLVLVGFAPVAAHLLGSLVARRPRLRVAAVLVGVATMGAHHGFFRDDYAEIHATVGVCAGLLVGGALAPAALGWLAARPVGARVVTLAVALLALLAGVGPTPNAVRKELFRSPGAIGAWALAMTRWEVPGLPPPAAPARGARFFRAPAEGDAPIPPTAPRLGGRGHPVVVFLTIDAVRADVLLDRSRDASWPALARLRDESAHFTQARSPGSQTAVSLTSAFSGRTFSELRWAKYSQGETRFEYAAEDPAPRLAGLLDAAGVDTSKIVGVNFLANEFGVASGFATERKVSKGRRHANARAVEGPLTAWLQGAGDGPSFFFAHFTEPHAPYDRGAVRDGPKKERYFSEIAALDAVIARLRAVLDGPELRGRSYLLLSADHGEAFGEHGTWEHTKTLYDELLRVPLLVAGPGVVPRTIDEPVSLLDVGPTVLDLFGEPTPASWVGQSLVPLLRGDDAPLERPILAEGRLRRAYVAPDGIKVIVDLRRKVVEAYDLAADPLELDDLWDRDPARAAPAAAAMAAFFDAREVRAPGYRHVYKP